MNRMSKEKSRLFASDYYISSSIFMLSTTMLMAIILMMTAVTSIYADDTGNFHSISNFVIYLKTFKATIIRIFLDSFLVA